MAAITVDTPTQPRRDEKKAQTRRRLLDAAAAVIAEKGFAGASLKEIAERAALTTGAVYSNFRSKEALLLAVVSDRMDRDLGPAPRKGTDLVGVARQAAKMTTNPGVQEIVHAQIELYLLGLRDAALREEMWAEEQEVISSMADLLAGVSARTDPGPPPTLRQLAMVFYATIQGMQQHRLLIPDALPVSLFEWWAKVTMNMAHEITSAADAP